MERTMIFIRKCLTIILSLVLAAGIMSVSAASVRAEESHGAVVDTGNADGGTWTFYEDGTLVLGGTSSISYFNRADVPWYEYMDQILHAEIGSDVTTLGNYLFCDAVNLQSAVLPEKLKRILLDAFAGCKSLAEIKFPDSLESIDYWAFSECESLKEVRLGKNMTEISNYVFQNASGLLRVVVEAPVERLGYDVFENCTSLKELYLPGTLTLIDKFALNNCPSLKDVYFAGSKEQWNRIKIENNNEILEQVEIHFDSSFDPELSGPLPDPEILGPAEPDTQDEGEISTSPGEYLMNQSWTTTINGLVQFSYLFKDQIVFVGSLLDQDEAEENFRRADATREEIEEELGTWECLVIPGQYKLGEAVELLIEVADYQGKYGNDLNRMLAEDDPVLEEFYSFAEPIFEVSAEKTETINGVDYVIYRQEYETSVAKNYITIKDGVIIQFRLVFYPEYEEEANVYINDFLGGVIYLEEKPAQEETETQEEVFLQGGSVTPGAEFQTEPEPAEPEMKAFPFLDGMLTLYIPMEEYDVLIEDNTDNQISLERQELSQDRADLYMSLSGYELKAVPVGQTFQSAETEIYLNIKDPAYEGIRSFRDLSAPERNLLAGALTLGFGSAEYSWYESEQVDYLVFDTRNETRYATIINGRMIYLFAKSSGAVTTAADKQMLREFASRIVWDLSVAK